MSKKISLEKFTSGHKFPITGNYEEVQSWAQEVYHYIKGDGDNDERKTNKVAKELFIRYLTMPGPEQLNFQGCCLLAFQRAFPKRFITHISTSNLFDVLYDDDGYGWQEQAKKVHPGLELPEEIEELYKDAMELSPDTPIPLNIKDEKKPMSAADPELADRDLQRDGCLLYLLANSIFTVDKWDLVLKYLVGQFTPKLTEAERALDQLNNTKWESIPSIGQINNFLVLIKTIKRAHEMSEDELVLRFENCLRKNYRKALRERGYPTSLKGYLSLMVQLRKEQEEDARLLARGFDTTHYKLKEKGETTRIEPKGYRLGGSDNRLHRKQHTTHKDLKKMDPTLLDGANKDKYTTVKVGNHTVVLPPGVDKNNCWKCNKNHGRSREECIAKDHTCLNCGKIGHLEGCCRMTTYRRIQVTDDQGKRGKVEALEIIWDTGAQTPFIGGGLRAVLDHFQEKRQVHQGAGAATVQTIGDGTISIDTPHGGITIRGPVGADKSKTILLPLPESASDLKIEKEDGMITTVSFTYQGTPCCFMRTGQDWVMPGWAANTYRRIEGITDRALASRFGYPKGTQWMTFIQDIHARLLHPAAEVIRRLLEEKGIHIPRGDIEDAIADCTFCKVTNVMVRGPRAEKSTVDAGKTAQKWKELQNQIGYTEEVEPEGGLENLQISHNKYYGRIFHHDLAVMPAGENGNRFLSVITDGDTGFLFLQPLIEKSQAHEHLSSVISSHGVPQALHTDNGGEFISPLYQDLLNSRSIAIRFSAPASPQSNGKAESAVKIAKRLIMKLLLRLSLKWNFWPWVAVGAANIHNILPSVRKNGSPFYLRWGNSPNLLRLPGDLVAFAPIRRYPTQSLAKGRLGFYLGKAHGGAGYVLERFQERREELHVLHPGRITRPILRTKDIESETLQRDIEKIENAREEDKEKMWEVIIYKDGNTTSIGRVVTRDQKSATVEQMVPYRDILLPVHETIVLHKNIVKEIKAEGDLTHIKNNKEITTAWNRAAEKRTRKYRALQITASSTRKATKQEIKSGMFLEKDKEELMKLVTMGAIEPNKPAAEGTTLNLIPVRTVTEIEGIITKCKTRFTVDGRWDGRDVECYKELPGKGIIRMGLQYAITKRLTIAMADITSAYLHARGPEGLNIRLPNTIPLELQKLGFVPNGSYKMVKAVYGVKDSAKLFIEHLERKLQEKGYERITEGLFKNKEDLIIAYVDDLLVISTNPVSIIEAIKEDLLIDEYRIVEDNQWYKYIGFEFQRSPHGIAISVKDYLKSNDVLKEGVRPLTKGDVRTMDDAEPAAIQAEQLSRVRGIIGKLGWAAQHNHPSSFLFSFMASKAIQLGQDAERNLERAAARMFNNPDETITPVTNPEIRIYADASLRLLKGKGRGGWIVQLTDKDVPIGEGGNVLGWRSFALSRLHGSTASAELSTLLQAVQGVSRLVHWIKRIWGDLEVTIYGDNVAGLAQVFAGKANGGGPADVEARLVAQEIAFRQWNVKYVSTKNNLADHLTKLVY